MSDPPAAETSFRRGCRRVLIGAALAVLVLAFLLFRSFAFPTYDRAVLKAINADSRALMAAPQSRTWNILPKSQWPAGIARLEPEAVTVGPGGVSIMMKADFDGGWGYYVPRAAPPKPVEPFSDVGEGVYWYHPD